MFSDVKFPLERAPEILFGIPISLSIHFSGMAILPSSTEISGKLTLILPSTIIKLL